MENRGDIPRKSAPADKLQGGGRMEWIDVARGIGIIAVVAGHVWTGGAFRDALYSFHMPLFFLLSGLLARPQPPSGFALRQLASQMRPYAAFLALLIIADQIIEPMKGQRPIFNQWPEDILPVLLGGSWLRGPYTIFWFVPCLMAARILFNALLSRWPDPLNWRWLVAIVPMTLCAYVVGEVTKVSVLGLLTVPMAFVVLWIGAAWQHTSWKHWMWFPLGAVALAGLSGLFPTLNMKAGDYGLPILSLASAVATSLLILRISVHVAPYGGWLAAVGRASLVIMYLHVAVIHYLAPNLDEPWLLLNALLLPIAAYYLLRASPTASRVFL
ncbi:MAG TPA: acyltransferase family protein [Sphingobium sp.]|nr:acyltransferase family protein [Sphingobium sp.]